MQIRQRIKTAKPDPKNSFEVALEQELQSYSMEVSQMLNKGLKFSDNFNAEIKSVADSGNANTEFSVAHTLKRTPSGFIIFRINKAGVVYDSGGTWSDTALLLKCSAANCAITLMVF